MKKNTYNSEVRTILLCSALYGLHGCGGDPDLNSPQVVDPRADTDQVVETKHSASASDVEQSSETTETGQPSERVPLELNFETLTQDPGPHIGRARVDKNGVVVSRTRERPPALQPLSADAIEHKPALRPQTSHLMSRPKISKLLRDKLQEVKADPPLATVRLETSVVMPRLPRFDPRVSRDEGVNVEILAERARIVQEVEDARAAQLAPQIERIRKSGVQVHSYNPLFADVSVRGNIRQFEELAELSYVKGIGYVEPHVAPPAGHGWLCDAREEISSDPWFDDGYTGFNNGFDYYVGILDTGTRIGHSALNVDYRRDCVNGDASTFGYCRNTASNPAYDPSDCGLTPEGHGTMSAGIISGNASFGDHRRGISEAVVDSWKVFDPNNHCGLDREAAKTATKAAIIMDDIIDFVFAAYDSNEFNTLDGVARTAFDSGAVLVASNGNSVPRQNNSRASGSPAESKLVMATTGWNILTGINRNLSRGILDDGRQKPDLYFPTNVEAASNRCDDCFDRLDNSSGSSPVAAGAAAILSNIIAELAPPVEPGKVYAAMYAFGDKPTVGDQPVNDVFGAGRFSFPSTCGEWQVASVDLHVDSQHVIPIDVAPGSSDLRAAIWWPGRSDFEHSDIDLQIDGPGGVGRDSGSWHQVAEKVTFSGPLSPGIYSMRIKGFDVLPPSAPPGVVPTQKVYYAVHYKKGC